MRLGLHTGIPGGGGAPWTPASLPSLALWLAGCTGITGDPVSAWANQGTLGGSFNQANVGERPPMSTLNSCACPDFDGTDDDLTYNGAAADFSFLHSGAGGTLIAVARPDDSANALQRLIDTGVTNAASTGFSLRWDKANKRATVVVANGGGVGFSVSAVTAGNSWLANAAKVVTVRIKTGAASEYDVRINGTSLASGAFAAATSAGAPAAALRVGERGTGTLNFGGKVADVIGCASYLSVGDCALAEGWATRRYAL